VIIVFLFLGHIGNAQTPERTVVLPPSEEKFSKAGDLIVPYRDTSCTPNPSMPEPGCKHIVFDDSVVNQVFTIYNSDGSEWIAFTLTLQNSPTHFESIPKDRFIPFATSPRPKIPGTVILRIAGESENWYEVEINENTRETRFISKLDRAWAKTSWEYWLNKEYNLIIDAQATRILDKPDGETVKGTEHFQVKTVRFLKADGDWALVQTKDLYMPVFRGWVRWREGRKILVGCAFNFRTLPTNEPN